MVSILRQKAKFYKLAISMLFVVILSYPATANAATGYYYNGGYKIINNNGALATIETQNPTIASGSWISAWSMCSDGTATNYAQVGWWKAPIAGWKKPYYFYEYQYSSNGTPMTQVVKGAATVGSHNAFMVGCDSTTMYFKINNISYGTVALSTIPFSRLGISALGETHNTADQCPGSVSNPVTIGGIQYKNTSNNWVSTKLSSQKSLSTMKNNIASSGSSTFEIWDSRY